MTEAMTFKFKFLDSDGQEDSFLAKKGALSPEGLVLGDESLPIEALGKASLHSKKYILLALNSSDEPVNIGLAITKGCAADLVRAMNALSSARLAKHYKEAIKESGEGGVFRFARCPHCRATVNLSDLPTTDQTACGYCDRLFSPENKAVPAEADFSLCEHCGYYGRVETRTMFYFYFLIFLWGFQSDALTACSVCAQKKNGWMVMANLLFILGLPNALYQWGRCLRAIEFDRSEFGGLEKANQLAEKGKVDEAVAYYDRLTRNLSLAGGVHYNKGRALLMHQRGEEALAALEQALAQCSNYFPALQLLMEAYASCGRHEQLAALKKRYGIDAPAPAEET